MYSFLFSILFYQKSRSLKFQILIRLVDFSNDSCYTKVEEPFFSKKRLSSRENHHFSLNLQQNSLIFTTKNSKC
ncbi:hypothetical protein D7L62_11385 [Enterococcus faecalis]|nr:hypothetical protein [Enterococcus faecalis]